MRKCASLEGHQWLLRVQTDVSRVGKELEASRNVPKGRRKGTGKGRRGPPKGNMRCVKGGQTVMVKREGAEV